VVSTGFLFLATDGKGLAVEPLVLCNCHVGPGPCDRDPTAENLLLRHLSTNSMHTPTDLLCTVTCSAGLFLFQNIAALALMYGTVYYSVLYALHALLSGPE
jgi:hypothetical protein